MDSMDVEYIKPVNAQKWIYCQFPNWNSQSGRAKNSDHSGLLQIQTLVSSEGKGLYVASAIKELPITALFSVECKWP